MEKSLIFEDGEGYLSCRYSGPFKPQPMADAARVILERAAAGGWTRVLIDTTGASGKAMSLAAQFHFGVKIARFWNPKIRTAGVTREDQSPPDFFLARVLQNRGVQIRIFTDSSEAMTWLMGEE